jgi:hypothetical protein
MEVDGHVTAFERSEVVSEAYKRAGDLKIVIANPRARAKST